MHTSPPSRDCNRLGLLGLILTLAATTAAAQTPSAGSDALERALAPGSTVWLTDATGLEAKARIVKVADGVVTTAGERSRAFELSELRRIRVRHHDPLLNGALIGAGTATAIGLSMCTLTEPWRNCRDDVGPMVKLGALGALAGVTVDALFPSRRTVFEATSGAARLELEPLLGPGSAGLRLSLGF